MWRGTSVGGGRFGEEHVGVQCWILREAAGGGGGRRRLYADCPEAEG